MKTTTLQTEANKENIIALPLAEKPPKETETVPQRFRIIPFRNHTGTKSWRVTGSKRDGKQVRMNFRELKTASVKRLELENEWLTGRTETAIRATKLTDDQIRLAESAFARLQADQDMPLAIQYWLSHGKQLSVAESPRIDEAFKTFEEWLPTSGLRLLSQKNLKRRVKLFVNGVPNFRVADFTHDSVEGFLTKRDVSPVSRDNDRRAISAFFSFCIERPRRWTTVNPCREIRIVRGEKAPPAVLTVGQCKTLLRESETFKDGALVPFVAVSLFAGLRPFEVSRLTWEAVNLADKEIRLEGTQTKTGKPRVVSICDTLAGWLKVHKGKPFFPSNWRKEFATVKEAIGYGTASEEKPDLKPWINDLLRHTAVSHYFRQTGSYGQTAEQFGNSEAVIKAHYQGRVSSEDTKKFYAIKPRKKPAK